MTLNAAGRRKLILVPAVITFVVTLIRLTGELANGSAFLFSRAAGGAGALIGIVWLIPFFGVYFAWKLQKTGHLRDPAWRILLFSILGFVLLIVFLLGANRLFDQFRVPSIIAGALGSIVAGAVVLRGSPLLFSTLIEYGLASRVPVAVIMFMAMLGNWGTHYDAPPPGFPEMGVLGKWVTIGLIPQLTVWITFTMVFGGFFAGLALLAFQRKTAA